jgi:hypothetical protein
MLSARHTIFQSQKLEVQTLQAAREQRAKQNYRYQYKTRAE